MTAHILSRQDGSCVDNYHITIKAHYDKILVVLPRLQAYLDCKSHNISKFNRGRLKIKQQEILNKFLIITKIKQTLTNPSTLVNKAICQS